MKEDTEGAFRDGYREGARSGNNSAVTDSHIRAKLRELVDMSRSAGPDAAVAVNDLERLLTQPRDFDPGAAVLL